MERKFKIVLILIVSLLWLVPLKAICLGATYYVDGVNGDDSNPGTSKAPWKTLNHAEATIKASDTVKIRNGTYDELTLLTPRTDWVTYVADSGHTPIIKGVCCGRWDFGEDLYVRFKDLEIVQGPTRKCGVWAYNCSYIELINIDFFAEGGYQPVSGTDNEAAVKIYKVNNVNVENCRFYGNAGYERDVEGGWQYAVTSRGTNHVNVKGCTAVNSRAFVHAWGTDWTISNNHAYNLDADGVLLASARDVLVEYNHIHDIGGSIFFTDNTGASYNETTKTITANVGDPYISGWNLQYIYATLEDGTRLPKKTIESSTTNTITLTDGYGQDYQNIILIEVLRGYHCDGLQMWTPHPYEGPDNVKIENIIIRGNRIYNSDGQGMLWNDIDGNAVNVTVENNLLYNTEAVTFHVFETDNLIFRNNTVIGGVVIRPPISTRVYGNIIHTLDVYTEEGAIVDYEDYNILIYKWVHMDNHELGRHSTELRDIEAIKNLFVSFDNNDYRLKEGSMAIDFCSPACATTATDILGNLRDAAPDAGCYEYGATKAGEDDSEFEELPDRTSLECNNNVFNPTKGEQALIKVELKNQSRVKLALYTARGNKIRELADEEKEPGIYKYYWDGKNDSGDIVGSGLYFVHIQAGDYKKTKKIVVVK